MSEPQVPSPSQPPDASQPPEPDRPEDRPEDLPEDAPGILGEDANADAIERVSLSSRLRQTRTIVSILIPLAIIGFFVALNREALSKVPELIAGADPVLVLVAFIVFYLGFPLRGLRWALLLRGTGFRIEVKDSTEILYLSWLVNCLIPAKLGDVYRAYLLRINSDASLSRTFGTVFIERILDIFTIALLGIAAGYWSFRNGLPPEIQVVFGIAIVIVVLLAVALFTLRNFGRRILVALPFPQRIVEFYDRFEQGVFGALNRKQLPGLAAAQHRDLDDRGDAPVLRGQGVRVCRCRARDLGGGLRRPHRLAAHGGSAEPGGAGHRGGGDRGHPHARVRGLRCRRRPRSPCSTA